MLPGGFGGDGPPRVGPALVGVMLAAQLHALRWWRTPRLVVTFVVALAGAYALLGLAWVATGGRVGVMLGLVSFAALVAVVLAVPALACSAVAGDRDRGVLPVLQLTALSGGQLMLGAWVAACGVGLLALLLGAPVLLVAAVLDGTGLAAPLATVAALVTATGCAGALGVFAGASIRRGPAAMALTQVLVAVLSVGTLIGYAVLVAMTPQTTQAPVRVAAVTLDPALGGTAPEGGTPVADEHGCVLVERDITRFRSDRVWPVLAFSPFVTLADALGAGPERPSVVNALSDAIRGTRAAPGDEPVENCPGRPVDEASAGSEAPAGGPVWPFGVAVSLLLTGALLWLSARRLRTPQDRVGHAPGSWRHRVARLPGLRRFADD